MKKNNPIHDDEIDFFELFKTVWNRKIIVIFTVLVSILIFSYIENQKPVAYNISLDIKASKASQFDQFLIITSFINNQKNMIESETKNLSVSVNNIEIYNKFINQIGDYDELIEFFRKNKYIKKQISQISEYDQKNILYGYFQSIKINKIDEDKAIISFKWNNSKEGEEILTDLISVVKKNLEKEVFLNLNNRVDLIKNIAERNNLSRIEYLLEQNEIAKELNISENQINSVNLYQSMDSVSLNDSQDNIAYYLRGYKAIEKEIALIQNRNFKAIKNVKKLISSLESNNQIQWIIFNPYSIKSSSFNNSNRNLILSIILGLLVGVGYILISRSYHSLKTKKKNN